MKAFSELSTQGKIRRYHQLAHKALSAYPIKIKQLRCISIRHNIIFRVGANEGVFMLRIGYPNIRSQIMVESEMRWIEAIHENTDLNLSHPIRTTHNERFITCELEGIPFPRHIALMTWLKGKSLTNAPNKIKLFQLGQALARLHNFADDYQASTPFMTFDNFRCNEWGGLHYLNEENSLLTTQQKTIFQQAIELSESAIEYHRKREGLKMIHADLHLKNANWYRGEINIFDFDDCRWGHFLQDWGVILSWFQENNQQDSLLREAFTQGYLNERPINYSENDLHLALMHRRMVGLTFVINHRPTKRQAIIDETFAWLQAHL